MYTAICSQAATIQNNIIIVVIHPFSGCIRKIIICTFLIKTLHYGFCVFFTDPIFSDGPLPLGLQIGTADKYPHNALPLYEGL